MKNNNISAKKIIISETIKYNGVSLLTYRIEYPEFSSSQYRFPLFIVNRYYRAKALELQRYCEVELFKQMLELFRTEIEFNLPIRTFEVLSTYNTTFIDVCIISLYSDRYEYTGGAHGTTVRDSQTWNLQDTEMLNLNQLFGCSLDYKDYIYNKVIEQIQKEPSVYFEDYERLVRETFNGDSFYCRPKGIVVYYQQYDIAPYVSGIREFLIPYNNCVINPKMLCL